jgi:protease IV
MRGERNFVMRKRVIFAIAAGVIIILLIAGSIVTKSNPADEESVFDAGRKRIALINIDGEIAATTPILEQLNTYGNMKSVRAVVLRVNSPGGGVGASQEIYRGVKKLKEKGKAIIVSMSDMGASGAYYISIAADKIYANPGTITGSIGVIVNYMNAEKLLGKIGVDFTTVKSGKYKDTGSFSRPVTPEDKELLKGLIEDVLNQFVDDIIENRLDKLAKSYNIKEKNEAKRKQLVKEYMLKNVADGRILTGRQALKLGLIDDVGNIDDAIEGAAAMVGIPGRPFVISAKKREGLGTWLNSKLEGLNFKEDTGIIKYLLK